MEMICLACKKPSEMLKLQDHIWIALGHPLDITGTFMCMDCVERQLGCVITCHDIDNSPTWWKNTHREYRRGIRDGVDGKQLSSQPQNTYEIGITVGNRLAANSTSEDIASFIQEWDSHPAT